jgi:hypothetical protein
MGTQINPDARAGKFTGRFAFHDRPEVLEELERAAIRSGTSAASIVRTAVRVWLAEDVEDER